MCKNPKILSNISRKGKIMVQIPKTYKCRLARLTNQLRQQHSKIGNTREQLLYKWQSFHFDENTETLDLYMICIGQVAKLLG